MRPYLTIIKDSFREAMVSRVLWVLLVLATLVLVALAPFSMTEAVRYKFGWQEVPAAELLLTKIKAEYDGDVPAPGKQIWPLLDDHIKNEFSSSQENEKTQKTQSPSNRSPVSSSQISSMALSNQLNELLQERDLYDEAAWQSASLSDEAKNLSAKGIDQLDESELGRFNRLLLDAAYPGLIVRSGAPAVVISYLVFPQSDPIPMPKRQLLSQAVTMITDFVAGTIGVFVAILVTSTIIPNTFESGSIDLLLSKPVSRPLVLLTKFVGGCAFILVVSTYFVLGIFLICGLRLDYWSSKLLLAIPVLLLVFSIYFSVSTLAGMIWRNAIVAVVITVVFWCACFGMRLAKTWIADSILTQFRIAKVVPGNDEVFVFREFSFGRVERFDRDRGEWSSTGEVSADELPGGTSLSNPRQPLPAFLDAQGDTIVVQPDGIYRYTRRATTADEPSDEGPTDGTSGDKDSPKKTDEQPQGAADEPSPEEDSPHGEDDSPNSGFEHDMFGPTTGVFDVSNLTAIAEPADKIGPRLRLRTPYSAAMNGQGDLAVFDGQDLAVYRRGDDGTLAAGAADSLPQRQAGVVGFGGDRVVLALQDGTVQLRDAEDLSLLKESRPEGNSLPRYALASPDGRFAAVVFHGGQLWVYDLEQDRRISGIPGAGTISAAAFDPQGRLLVAHHFNRVTRHQLDPLQTSDDFSPEMNLWARAYWYAIVPLYEVFPKPGELGNLVQYLISGQQTEAVYGSQDLSGTRVKINIWNTLWSNLAFLALMLGISCWYVTRKDF